MTGLIWEVIADHSERPERPPFGLCFRSQTQARAYTRALRRLGYTASISPPYRPETDLAEALKSAALYWDDDKQLAQLASEARAER